MGWRRTTAALCCLLAVLAACSRGGDDDGQQAAPPGDDAATEATEATSAPSPEPATAAPTAPTAPAEGDGAAAEQHEPADDPAAADPGQALLPEGSFGGDPVASDDFPATGRAVAQLTDVQVGTSDEGADRVVLEFAGDEMPSYRVGLVDGPVVAEGSGEEVEGSSFLEIRVTPAQAGAGYGGPERVEGDTSTIVEVVRTGDVDGQLTWVVGLRQDMPFAVTTDTDPLRLVVDVALL